MKPRTLRTIGTACVGAGVAGLAVSVVVASLVATGAMQQPATIMVVLVPVQSIVNVAAGWNLRRQTSASIE